jgi:hypothetical protein
MNYTPAEYPTTVPIVLPETMDMYRKNRGLNTYDEHVSQVKPERNIIQEELRRKTIEWYKTPSGIFWLSLLIIITVTIFLIIVYKSDK